MKKMIIYMPKLSVGGMEKALLNLLNFSSLTQNYRIEIFLGYLVQPEYLNMVPKDVKVYLCCKGKWNILGKIITYFKMLLKKLKVVLKIDQYDVAISYAYQHPILSFLARLSSDNNIIFIHNNLKLKYKDNKKHLKKMKFDKFKKVICVSENAKQAFIELYPNFSGDVVTINNFLDGKVIEEKSLEKVEFNYEKPVFVVVARCEEISKRISRVIKASRKLFDEKYRFSVIIVGDGEDFEMYKKMVSNLDLNNVVFLVGRKINPYPYIKKSSALVLSSAFEGYGIVIDEARILNVPVIATDVADAKEILAQGYGIICDNSDNGVFDGMKKFLDEGYTVSSKFDYNEFNKELDEKLNKIIEK